MVFALTAYLLCIRWVVVPLAMLDFLVGWGWNRLVWARVETGSARDGPLA